MKPPGIAIRLQAARTDRPRDLHPNRKQVPGAGMSRHIIGARRLPDEESL
jgi:hypothetical protein